MGGGGGSKAAPFAKEMTQKEIDEAMEKLFGKGTKKSRAEAALPGILTSIEQQRMAQLQNVPSIEGIIGQLMQQNPTVSSSAMPQMGILGTLSDLGLQQLSQDRGVS
tara:strand:- start:1159 stop:1479 length:321 start_codon:yes stop_codon:yes gene_type:complete